MSQQRGLDLAGPLLEYSQGWHGGHQKHADGERVPSDLHHKGSEEHSQPVDRGMVQITLRPHIEWSSSIVMNYL